MSAKVEKVGNGKGVCLSQCSTGTPDGRQNRGMLSGRANSVWSPAGYLHEGGENDQIHVTVLFVYGSMRPAGTTV